MHIIADLHIHSHFSRDKQKQTINMVDESRLEMVHNEYDVF